MDHLGPQLRCFLSPCLGLLFLPMWPMLKPVLTVAEPAIRARSPSVEIQEDFAANLSLEAYLGGVDKEDSQIA